MRDRTWSLVVLAAGLGSRFGGPKQVEAVGPSGEILLDYSIYDALHHGATRVVLVVRDEVEAVLRPRLDAALAGRCDLAFVSQRQDDLPSPFTPPAGRTRPWGTGHAILACQAVLDGPFAVLNADDFYGADAFARVAALFRDAREPDAANALVGYTLDQTLTEHGTVSRGICQVGPCGTLTSIVERHGVSREPDGQIRYTTADGTRHPIPRDAVASMNFWALDACVVPRLEQGFREFLGAAPGDRDEYRLPTAIGALIDRGALSVRVISTAAEWLGVTHRDDLAWVRAALQQHVERGDYPSPLWPRRRSP